jgi:predicted outer membrane protein
MKRAVYRIALTSVFTITFLVPVFAHNGNQFLSRATEVSATEVRLAEIAKEKTQDPIVHAFAEAVVSDQNDAVRRLMDLRVARTMVRVTAVSGNSFTCHTGWRAERICRSAGDIPITAEHHRAVDRLSSIPSSDFDREFISEIIREYRDAIDFFEGQARMTGKRHVRAVPQQPSDYSSEDLLKDIDTMDFAAENLPKLRLRLQEAEAIQKRLQKR